VHDDHERRLSFGAIAAAYDRERPRYPDSLIERIVERVGIGRALEIGCGTGIATLPFAERGYAIEAVEPSEKMAAIARAKFAAFPRVRITTSAFEDWTAPPERYDLVYAAQAWHWITPEAKAETVPRVLRDGGHLAVFGHVAVDVLDVAQPAYARFAPERFIDPGPVPALETRIDVWADPVRERFCDVTIDRWPWSRRFTADAYLRLLGTYSDHTTIPEPRRSRLFEAIREAIENDGGTAVRSYEAVLVMGRWEA